ncbi:hypothetical protein METBIDRAFT_43974 [Metschnikowia bicuspidata var. bicuspidata NRRL YB-4993]|uniref:tRNA (guanine(9)-N1)-methyltransferase n=1 Tax=Metschnikowia bicuspidata var. bicuspidata NRRL YB-4993 TaxID=869754 RepID=A0A1A0H954_9ASCO|nr:hypothetical protein METBIDRAFT_43974 [Metschnikowia bicuspidata var. bicuspidata NRRL YB-4993]OBA20541.1 hypothetical protein METBIDRAFT_43974 [Metschnikowia bicuspidata var. bicuspidata NRRL YB-4993]
MSSTNSPPNETANLEHAIVGEFKRQKVELPEGMSKNAWKRLQKQQRWEEQKDDFRLKRREKKRVARQRKSERKMKGLDDEESNYHQEAKKELPQKQEPSGVNIIMDCEFDELMNDKEIVSMSNQITRCYSAKRHSKYEVGLTISSFNKRLRQRFDKSIQNYAKWKNIQFEENETLEDLLPADEKERAKYVYLTADTDEELLQLEEGHTYILGGIVDKNRHKELCFNKAKKLGLRVGRLPIGKYIQMNSRHVLATSHVYEIMCMWLENKDWEKSFNSVLPPRKLKKDNSEGVSDELVTKTQEANTDEL